MKRGICFAAICMAAAVAIGADDPRAWYEAIGTNYCVVSGRVVSVKATGLTTLKGSVVSVLDESMLILRDSKLGVVAVRPEGGTGPFFDNAPVLLAASQDGFHQYITVAGANAKVRAFRAMAPLSYQEFCRYDLSYYPEWRAARDAASRRHAQRQAQKAVRYRADKFKPATNAHTGPVTSRIHWQ